MADPVNLADVLDTMNGPLNPEVTPEQVGPAVAAVLAYGGLGPAVAAVLAYGGGDPVVVMPDGTLRRLGNAPEELGKPGMYYLSDPVVPE